MSNHLVLRTRNFFGKEFWKYGFSLCTLSFTLVPFTLCLLIFFFGPPHCTLDSAFCVLTFICGSAALGLRVSWLN
jgi:hypothetical protein